MKTLFKLSVLGTALALAACSTTTTTEVDYKSAQRGNALEVPPDLTKLSNDGHFSIPGEATSAAAYQKDQTAGQAQPETAVNAVGDVQIKRDGNQRWLSVNRPPAQIWNAVRTFWENNGFVLTTDNQRLGIMETDWAENRAKLPQDIIRSTLGKMFDALYSTGELDRFRTRLERNAQGGTDIFISHRGMEEVYSTNDKSATRWQPRPVNPELEDEFLRRLMVALGVSKERAAAMVQANPHVPAKAATAPSASPAAAAAAASGVAIEGDALVLSEDFERAWRRVGLSLDRTGFSVEDRDQKAGVYDVRYVPLVAPDAKKPGVLTRLFKKAPETQSVHYQVRVQPQGGRVMVRVYDAQGNAAPARDGNHILQVLADDLRQM